MSKYEGGAAGPWVVYRGPLRPHLPTEIIEIHDQFGRVIVKWQGFDDIRWSKKRHAAHAALLADAPMLLAQRDELLAMLRSIARADDSLPPNEWWTARELIARVKATQ